MSRTFVDPRNTPDPGAPRPAARFTADAAELAELYSACREGRLYYVEHLIQAGRPLQLAPDSPLDGRQRFRTALEIALGRQDQSLMLLLLANGYDLAAEPRCPLDPALQSRRRDLIELLLNWGADPQEVDLDILCGTYSSELYERFRGLGVDLTVGHALAYALGYHASNKPLFGFAKRHRSREPRIQTELDIALAHHAAEGNEKGVMLSMWAGADAHARVLRLRWGIGADEDEAYSAVYEACSNGQVAILDRLQPDPILDDYDELYRSAANEKVVEVLARSRLPKNPSTHVAIQLGRSAWPFRRYRPVETLRALFEAGVRWEGSPAHEIADARRSLLKTDDRTFIALMKLLATADNCGRKVLTEIARTPSMRKRMKALKLIPRTRIERSEFHRSRPAKALEILAKFGIDVPKQKKPVSSLTRTVRIGTRSQDGPELRLDRSGLLRCVWSVPVEMLAREWGLSGRGLAKACHRLQVPVPPRGYWAKVAAGQRVRRPKLPALPPGQGEQILIRLPERKPE